MRLINSLFLQLIVKQHSRHKLEPKTNEDALQTIQTLSLHANLEGPN